MRWSRKKPLAAGDAVPDLRLELLGGGEEPLRSAGRTVLAFFKVTCPVCQFALPYLARIHPAVKVRAVSQNDAADSAEFARYYGVTYPMLLDPEDDFPASNAFGIDHVPAIFIVDDGRIERVINGWSRDEMLALGALRQDENVPAWKAG